VGYIMGFKKRQIRARRDQSKRTISEIVAQPNKGPSVGQLAANFGKAVVEHIVDGFEKVTLPVYQARLNACNNCEEFYENGRCLHPKCGCILANKAWWASESCPLEKWSEKTQDQT